MATVINLPCPNCEKILKVPETAFGKRVQCKYCGEKFEVEEPDPDDEEDEPKPKKAPKAGNVAKPSTVNASKPGGAVKPKKEEPKKEEPKKEAAPAAYKVAMDDDEEGDGGATPNPLGIVDEGEDIPRCPHCAQELDPPDAVVCVHCGFNNLTRTQAESKKTWAPTGEDWFHHLLPGILALAGCIALIVVDVLSYMNMEDWLTDTFLMNEKSREPGAKVTFFTRANDAFTMFILAASVMPIIKLGRFAIIRLAINNKPEEKVKT